MPPTSLSTSAPGAAPPLYFRRPVIAAAAAASALAALLLFAAAYAPWRTNSPLTALLRRQAPATAATRFYSFELVREYPHDPDAFTQVRFSSSYLI